MDSEPDRSDDRIHPTDPLARLRAGREPGEDLLPAIVLVSVTVFVPLLVAARYEDHLRMYMNSEEYTILVGLGVALGLWLVVDGLDLDRVTVFGTVVMAPIPITSVLGLFIVSLELEWLDGVGFLEFGPLSFAIITGGAVAVGLSLLTEQLSIRHARLPARRRVTAAAGATALFGIGTGAGVQYATPPAASIEDVDVYYSGREATFWVNHVTDSTDLHIAVVAPDGTTATRRLVGSYRNWWKVRVPQPERSLYRGRFEVSIATFWGNTVDSTSITVENGPVLSIRRVEAERSRPDEVVVTATVSNDGDVAARTEIDLHGSADDQLDGTTVTIEPVATTTVTLTAQRTAFETDSDSAFVAARLERGRWNVDRHLVDLPEE